MAYLATLTLDYSGTRDSNAYNQLLNALEQAGWLYAETSAMYVECEDLQPILLGLELLARAVGVPGDLSALNLQVQFIGYDRSAPGAPNHRRALSHVLARPLPSD